MKSPIVQPFARRLRWLPLATTLFMIGCRPSGPSAHVAQPLNRLGDEIVVAGSFFHTGAEVVLWLDPGGYDAYRYHCHFDPNRVLPLDAAKGAMPNRYDSMRRGLPPELEREIQRQGWSLKRLEGVVDQLVIHYDVCGLSRRCFQVLHDQRGLSTHYMIDLDGTIYQTLDVKERARHAGVANERSIGIELANIGAYPKLTDLDAWYRRDEQGRTWNRLEKFPDTGLRRKEYVPRPSQDAPIYGTLQNQSLVQYDFTEPQYESLIRLTATLCKVLPGIKVDVPRDANGAMRTSVLTVEELASYKGLLGHYHISDTKVDPGPAFDWERLLRAVASSS